LPRTGQRDNRHARRGGLEMRLKHSGKHSDIVMFASFAVTSQKVVARRWPAQGKSR
jgi:hypothetical protein